MLNVADLPNYEEKIEIERRSFEIEKYNPETLVEQVPEALGYSHDAFHEKVRRSLGKAPWDYIVAEVNARPGAQILSIGSGACGLEIALAKRFEVPFQLTCVDLNDAILAAGKEKAQSEGIPMEVIPQDGSVSDFV